jgi:hypothetical protein
VIVLDAQLSRRRVREALRWYPGSVQDIADVAFTIGRMLRTALRHPAFRSKRLRRGKVLRITSDRIQSYSRLAEPVEEFFLE